MNHYIPNNNFCDVCGKSKIVSAGFGLMINCVCETTQMKQSEILTESEMTEVRTDYLFIIKPRGDIEFGPAFTTVSEASLSFWKYVKDNRPDATITEYDRLKAENVRLRNVMEKAANLEMVHNDAQLSQALKEYYNPELPKSGMEA